jgi:hypothetical protein
LNNYTAPSPEFATKDSTTTGSRLKLRGFANYFLSSFVPGLGNRLLETRIRRLAENLPVFRNNKYLLLSSPFSYAFHGWIDKCRYFKRWSLNVSIGIEDPELDKLPVELGFKHFNTITKIASGVYHIRYREVTDSKNSIILSVLGFVNEKGLIWTKEKIEDFYISFSRKIARLRFKEAEKERNLDAFNGLFLNGNLLQELKQDIEDFLESRKLYKKLNLPWKRGYCFIGPPGVGKTLTIRKIQDYFGLLHRDINWLMTDKGTFNTDLLRACFIGEILFPRLRRVRTVVMEDLDKTVKYQASSLDPDEGRVSLHSILKGLDGVDSIKIDGVIFIATTNHPEQISEALLARPGRFDRIFKFEKPNEISILNFLKYRNIVIKDMPLSQFAREMKDLSLAFVEEWVKSCRMRYRRSEVSYAEAQSILKGIYRHNELYKQHFKETNRKIGF